MKQKIIILSIFSFLLSIHIGYFTDDKSLILSLFYGYDSSFSNSALWHLFERYSLYLAQLIMFIYSYKYLRVTKK